MNYQTINVRFQEPICFIQFNRPQEDNTINELLIEEFNQVLALCEETITVIVIEGSQNVFCMGADFKGMHTQISNGQLKEQDPEHLYNLWLKMATGPYVTISHVKGRANAGGIGFVAASDIVIADQTAQFSLSELLFGLMPACVLPFLIRKVGYQKANYMTLMTQPISCQQAQTWGLVDAMETPSEVILRKHLLRLKNLSKTGIMRYKKYVSEINPILYQSKIAALAANREVFSDPKNIEGIFRYIDKGKFPWESD